MKTFYVYIYKDQNGIPFYVGKGSGLRWKDHLSKSHNKQVKGKIAKIRATGVEPTIQIVEAENEDDAFEIENCLIVLIGKRNIGTGTLWNFNDGGSGTTWSTDITAERRREITKNGVIAAANANRGKKQKPESIELRRAKQLGKKRPDSMKENLKKTLSTKSSSSFMIQLLIKSFGLI